MNISVDFETYQQFLEIKIKYEALQRIYEKEGILIGNAVRAITGWRDEKELDNMFEEVKGA